VDKGHAGTLLHSGFSTSNQTDKGAIDEKCYQEFRNAGVRAVGCFNPHAASDLVQVTVPFAFQAAGKVLPVGDYRFSLDQKSDLVTITGSKVFGAILLTVPGDQLHNERSVSSVPALWRSMVSS
jgi:hypothetical protein